jgi:PAS domain-containing protein
MNAEPHPLRPGDTQTVTASTLVRQFGLWQERAARAPVYVLHRGRPRLALTSIDLIEAMCAAQPGEVPDTMLDPLLEVIREIVVIVDAQLVVTRLSAEAQRFFSSEAHVGAPFDRVAPGAVARFITETMQRVIDRGIGETVEVTSHRGGGRRLLVDIKPWQAGAALFAHDISTEDELRDAHGHVRAIDQALAVVEDAATARINLRGYLDRPTPSLAALTGIATETLASVRFVTLLDVGSRVAVAEAIEAVIADGAPRGVTAMLPVNRGATRPIRIGLSLLSRGVAPDGIAAILIGDPPLSHDR